MCACVVPWRGAQIVGIAAHAQRMPDTQGASKPHLLTNVPRRQVQAAQCAGIESCAF